jgi:hypothetical protein
LEQAIKLAQAIYEKNAGKPVRAEDLATMVGFRQARDWRFLDLLRSANQYGLVDGSGAAATVTLSKIGSDIVAPSSAEQRKKALLEAFRAVQLFAKVLGHYEDGRIPEDEYFANTLVRDFGVERDRVNTFIKVFVDNAQFVKAFARDRRSGGDKPSGSAVPQESANATAGAPESDVRQFLDTCFVLMPFGGWFDRYYKEIYMVAIKDSGFEPVRADGLFDTGSVMEQIWLQIKKAKVLLADLTGKNPNVFYELGLAHAIRKPVVFVASTIDDVPFDLRHLRVVLYEVQEPGWSDKLKRDIVAHLKGTREEPEKTIPQPFRDEKAELGAAEILGGEEEVDWASGADHQPRAARKVGRPPRTSRLAEIA